MGKSRGKVKVEVEAQEKVEMTVKSKRGIKTGVNVKLRVKAK